MSQKTVLVAGASGLVGYAAMKHFADDPACKVIAVSRRRPDETFGARIIAADLTDARS
jgi:NAD(P)-dependent dehydrogenase (short-subunit alcohol dehydrogenase family)